MPTVATRARGPSPHVPHYEGHRPRVRRVGGGFDGAERDADEARYWREQAEKRIG